MLYHRLNWGFVAITNTKWGPLEKQLAFYLKSSVVVFYNEKYGYMIGDFFKGNGD